MTMEKDQVDITDQPRGSDSHATSGDLPTGRSRRAFSTRWTAAIDAFEMRYVAILRIIARHATKYPKSYIVGLIVLSLGILGMGYMTNFNVLVDDKILWTPAGSNAVVHMQWLRKNLPELTRPFALILHANGENVIQQEAFDRMFDVLDGLRGLPEYDAFCSQYIGTDKECWLYGVTTFWNNNKTIYQDQVKSHEDLIKALSSPVDARGLPVDFEAIVGYPVYEADGVTVASGKSCMVFFSLPEVEGVLGLEEVMVETIVNIRKEWAGQNTIFHLEGQAESSMDEEFYRGIIKDIPLIPLGFFVMSIFTCLTFYSRDPIQSRCWVGFGAIVSVLLSLFAGFGLMFCFGVPFTSITSVLPFVMFGIGLDDAFILTGEYYRTDAKKDPVERIDESLEAVGMSMSLTTMTSIVSFGLGSMSSIPAIYWLCYYAPPALVICFLYNITFFAAVIVIDEQRIRAKRRDCCFCRTEPSQERTAYGSEATSEVQESIGDRLMLRYANFILRPWVKAAVLLLFSIMLAGFSYRTSMLKQEFKFLNVLPRDSYLVDFITSWDKYYSKAILFPRVYFRYVDQSDPEIQDQMIDYVNELSMMDSIGEPPRFFWLKHFRELQANYSEYLTNVTFNEQVEFFLHIPVFEELYSEDIIRNENGDIEVSRVTLFMNNVDIDDVKDQISIMTEQREVTESQPINQGKSDLPFFNYEPVYNIWAFYTVAVHELILTTITGVVSVALVALILMPHWTAWLFVLPLISILYIDLLGFLQMCGAEINAVSYFSMVMSIGLMIDFLIHVLLRYYECEGGREEKVRQTLKTMGTSILMGALSTFLGIMPLGFSSSEIIKIVFYAFVGLVTIGAAHGLILLPVILSIIGPEDCILRVRGLDLEPNENGFEITDSLPSCPSSIDPSVVEELPSADPSSIKVWVLETGGSQSQEAKHDELPTVGRPRIEMEITS